MSTEFNIDLPPRFDYNGEVSAEENLKVLSDYILRLHIAIEETFHRLFDRTSTTADSATVDNLASLDADGNLTDSGCDVSTDGTMAGNSDSSVPTEKAIVTYITAFCGDYLPLVGGVMEGDIDFDQNEALQFVFENRTTDPDTPVIGQAWIRTNL
jgi:hypothetical protein